MKRSAQEGEITDDQQVRHSTTRVLAEPAAGPVSRASTAATSPIVSERVDDASLISRSLVDSEAFAGVFDRHARAIHRYLSRRVGSDIADDLTGETFLVAFDRRERYDPAYPDALPWLYGIATKLLGRHRRTEARRWKAWARTGLDPVQECHAEEVSARVSAQSASRAMAGALAGLPAAQRDVLLLVAWQGLEYEEIARALEVPVGTVRSRLHRARARLKGSLAPVGPPTLTEE